MKRTAKTIAPLAIATILLGVPIPVHAEGNPEEGEKNFKKCAVCHSLEEGKKKIGPSLFNLIDRKAGVTKGYKYSADYVEAGNKELK